MTEIFKYNFYLSMSNEFIDDNKNKSKNLSTIQKILLD